MSRFDDRYYQRFYGPTGVHDRDRIGHLASGVHGLCAWWGVEPQSVLDVGAGVGLWRDWYRTNHPGIATLSVDISEYACAQWGHEQHDIAEWQPDEPFDLVVCHGVVHYLDDDAAAAAMVNLGAATNYVLYLEAPTARDLAEVVDPERTDMDVFRRSGEWYRERLDPYFAQAGAGLWVRHGTVTLFELEGTSRRDPS